MFHFWENINWNQTLILDPHRPFIYSVVPSFGSYGLMRHIFRQQGITTCLVDVASHLVKTFIHQVHPLKKLFATKNFETDFVVTAYFLNKVG